MRTGTFVTATRIGFAARGIMYLLVAYFALSTGLAEDGAEALGHLETGAGRVLLALMAVGFMAYGVWRLSEAFIDSEGHGSDAKGIALRAGGAVSGLIHLSLSVYAAKLSLGTQAGSPGSGTEEGAATALSLPGGELLVGIAAAALFLMGLYQFINAVQLKFRRHLDQRVANRPWVAWAGRLGYAARGVVFVLIGIFFWRAMERADAAEAGGMGEALASLPSSLHTIVAIGLLMFGLFSLVEARYRHITNPRLLERLEHGA
jgi:hypothetical protein